MHILKRWTLLGFWSTLVGCLALGGCAVGRQQSDLLSAKLRQTNSQIHRLETDLIAARDELRSANDKIARMNSAATEAQMAKSTRNTAPPQKLEFHTRLTALQDDDQTAGSETIVAFVTPRDASLQPTTVDGQLEVIARDVNTNAVVARWYAEGPHLARYWYSGFLGSGYQITLRSQQAIDPQSILIDASYTDHAGTTISATHAFTEAAGLASTRPQRETPASFTNSQQTHRPDYSAGEFTLPQLPPENNSALDRASELGPTSVNWTDETMPIRR